MFFKAKNYSSALLRRGCPFNTQQKRASCLATLCCQTTWKVRFRVLSPTFNLSELRYLLSVMSLDSSYQRKTRIFIFIFLLLCPCNQSIAQSRRNTDGVELPLRHMKYYKTSATIMEFIEGPTTDNRPMCLFIFFYFIIFFIHVDVLGN